MEYQAQFYIPARGISREVITTDICRYLGNNARISRPNIDANGEIIGYWYCAYRAFTHEMERSLKDDSAKWNQEKERTYRAGYDVQSYANSRTYHDVHPPTSDPIVIPPPGPAHEKPNPKYVYDAVGNPVYDLEKKEYLLQRVPTQPGMEDPPRGYPIALPPVPPTQPAAPPNGYWALDPATGQRCFVVEGRILHWAPYEDHKESVLQ